MNRRSTFVISGLSLLTLSVGLLIAPTSFVSAQATTTTNNSGQALEIAPPVVSLTADPGQTITTEIKLRDISSGKLLVQSQVNDFVSNGEDGIPKLILDGNDTNPFSMKNWVEPPADMTLNPKQLKSLPITINVPANASPGGYYGAIRFTAMAPELKGTGVSLSASLGALIFIRVNGAAKEKLDVVEFSATHDGKAVSLFESVPIQFLVKLKNSGNIYEEPAGQVTITDMFGNKLAVANVNIPAHNILPDSTRKFEQSLTSSQVGNKILFGRYKADLRLTYGDSKQVITSSITFWVIPWRLILVVVALVIGGFTTLYFAIKRYNRFIIGKAQGSSAHRKRKSK